MHLTPAEHERFMDKTVEDNGCWLWQGPLDRDGYGTFYLRRKARRAHRVAWFMLRGPIPDGMVVNHACKRRNCVNPQHLNLYTVQENSLKDSTSPAAVNARKTHCPVGHEYNATYVNGKGRTVRYCTTCERAKQRRLKAKWRAEDTVAC